MLRLICTMVCACLLAGSGLGCGPGPVPSTQDAGGLDLTGVCHQSVTIEYPADLEDAADCRVIIGNLHVIADFDVALPLLERVEGNVSLNGAPRLPRLTSVAGHLEVSTDAVASAFAHLEYAQSITYKGDLRSPFPALRNVGALSSTRQLDLPLLEEARSIHMPPGIAIGALEPCLRAPKLESAATLVLKHCNTAPVLPRLQRVSHRLFLQEIEAEVYLPHLSEVGEFLVQTLPVVSADALLTADVIRVSTTRNAAIVSFLSLEDAGLIELSRVSSIQFPALRSAEELHIEGNTLRVPLSLPHLSTLRQLNVMNTRLSGIHLNVAAPISVVDIHGNYELRDIAFSQVRSLNTKRGLGWRIRDNPALLRIALPLAEESQHLVEVLSNRRLRRIDAPRLTGNGLVALGNPDLEYCGLEALIAAEDAAIQPPPRSTCTDDEALEELIAAP